MKKVKDLINLLITANELFNTDIQPWQNPIADDIIEARNFYAFKCLEIYQNANLENNIDWENADDDDCLYLHKLAHRLDKTIEENTDRI